MPASTLPATIEKRKSPTRIDIGRAWQLRIVNKLTYDEIAAKLGCSVSGVYEALEKLDKLMPDPEAREAFSRSKAEVLEAVQLKLTASLVDPAKISKATLGNVAYAVSKLHDMTRLERNQSTSNVSVLSKIIDDSHNQLFASKTQHIDEPSPFD